MLPSPKPKPRIVIKFDDDLKGMLYAFGGDTAPQRDSIELLNDLTVDFISKVTAEAAANSKNKGSKGEMISVKNILQTTRDPMNTFRANELLESYKEIKKLRFFYEEALHIVRKSDRPSESKKTRPSVDRSKDGEKVKKKKVTEEYHKTMSSPPKEEKEPSQTEFML